MLCPSCDAPNRGDAKFCKKCGHSFLVEAAQVPEVAEMVVTGQASAGAAAYSTAKAAEVHLARCLALEGADHGIRVNVVNPDAVIRGSRIWGGSWKSERAASNRIGEEDVEEFYRKRSLLKRSVFPEDIAEGIYFFAADLSMKSTGNILNVDAGNLAGFTR